MFTVQLIMYQALWRVDTVLLEFTAEGRTRMLINMKNILGVILWACKRYNGGQTEETIILPWKEEQKGETKAVSGGIIEEITVQG